MIVIERSFIQGSDAWMDARLGNMGATGLKKIITSKGERSKSREKYMWELAEECISGERVDSFQTYWTKRGLRLEPEARKVFNGIMGVEAEEVAMIYPDEKKEYHISPDGILEDQKKGVEIKCLSLEVFDKYKSKGVLPTEFKLQIQGSLSVTGWDSWYWFLYYPELTPMLLEIERDENFIKIIKAETNIFIRELNQLIERLKKE
ncbi:MAG: YqaJ viral recombinase family protein [Candidatus Peribacteraceae bacterium]|nr:YqaJ viral recombinase family protein [Candidatus Peribacteraceae bacterium]